MRELTSSTKYSLLGHLIILMSAVLASMIASRLRLSGWLVGMFTFLFLEVVVGFSASRRLRQLHIESEKFSNMLQSLSIADAREEALDALQSNKAIVTYPAVRARDSDCELCSSLEEIFSKYKSIEFEDNSVLELGRTSEGYTDVGHGPDGGHLIVRNHDQVLIESETVPPTKTDEKNCYPSIYHWIVFNVRA